ncbi:unnamed protein product [Fraxinus pennsylvanica]|uniref:Uncharacterized protein n=1 Tax=Fraxinus pennsylvanica TaxID=56036 RepID=A0AAD2A1Z4_9LAMI|nr:unnamed protein product [Fraxinus pennsylvanica]
MDKYAKKQERLEIGQKRRLIMSPSVENLHDVRDFLSSSSLIYTIFHISNYTSQDEEELVNIQLEIETLFSSPKDATSEIGPSTKLNSIAEGMLEEMPREDLIFDYQAEEILVASEPLVVEVEDLVTKTSYWGEDLQDLVVNWEIFS